MVTVNGHVDIVCVTAKKEAMEHLRWCRDNTDMLPQDIVRHVAFNGISLRDSVVVFSAFMKESEEANVIMFNQYKGKRIPYQFALDYKEAV